jgi:hypothetical protein
LHDIELGGISQRHIRIPLWPPRAAMSDFVEPCLPSQVTKPPRPDPTGFTRSSMTAFACRHVRTCTDREQPTQKIVRRRRITRTSRAHSKKWHAAGSYLPSKWSGWTVRKRPKRATLPRPQPLPGVQAFPTWSLITRHNFGMPEIGNPDRWLHSGTVFASGFPAYGSSGETATFLLTARGRRRAAAIGRGS